MNNNDFEKGYGIEGNQWTDPRLMQGVAGGYRVGGQWRHFVQYDPNGYDCEHSRYNHNHTHFSKSGDVLPERTLKLFGGNAHQLENLKKLTKEKEMTKIVYFDIQSILFGSYRGYESVSIQTSIVNEIKETFMMLRFYGFTPRLIVRDLPSGVTEIDNVVNNFLGNSGGLTIIASYLNDDGVSQPIKDENILDILKINTVVPFTKVYYVGNSLLSTGFANGLLRPVLLTTSDAHFMEKNVADYVTVSPSVSGQHVKEVATALLYAHGINPLNYLSKARRKNLRGDVISNYTHKLGNNLLFVDNSMSVEGYLNILETKYRIDRTMIYSTISHVNSLGNLNSANDVYISTVLKYFLDNFGSLKLNRVYFLNVFDENFEPDDNTLTLLKQMDINHFPEMEWSFLVSHFDEFKLETNVLKFLRKHKLYNVMSMLNVSTTRFTDVTYEPI